MRQVAHRHLPTSGLRKIQARSASYDVALLGRPDQENTNNAGASSVSGGLAKTFTVRSDLLCFRCSGDALALDPAYFATWKGYKVVRQMERETSKRRSVDCGIGFQPVGCSIKKVRCPLIYLAILLSALFAALSGQTVLGEDLRSPSVGAAGNIDQIILPGSELMAKPLVEGSPIVIRIVKVFPHGDQFRYDLLFHGMEPGKFDLSNWLVRKDGSSTDDLPEIPVEIRSLLPPGQIEPNALEQGWLPRLGGYRMVMGAVILLWSLVLAGLIFLGRKKKDEEAIEAQPVTLADLLKTRIEAALSNQMDKSQYAELERMLTAFWTKRLGLESEPPHTALVKIKQHSEAGPLMKQLETWMHSPKPDHDVDLAKLLDPFKKLPIDTPGFGE